MPKSFSGFDSLSRPKTQQMNRIGRQQIQNIGDNKSSIQHLDKAWVEKRHSS